MAREILPVRPYGKLSSARFGDNTDTIIDSSLLKHMEVNTQNSMMVRILLVENYT